MIFRGIVEQESRRHESAVAQDVLRETLRSEATAAADMAAVLSDLQESDAVWRAFQALTLSDLRELLAPPRPKAAAASAGARKRSDRATSEAAPASRAPRRKTTRKTTRKTGADAVPTLPPTPVVRRGPVVRRAKTAERIIEHVAKHPGCTLADIAAALDMTDDTATFQIRRLRRHGRLRVFEARGQQLYYEA